MCFSVDGFYSENKVVKDGRIAPMSQSGYMPSFMLERLSDVKKMRAKNIEMENGTSVSKALRVHSETLRTRRRQQVEEEAAKTAVKLAEAELIAAVNRAIAAGKEEGEAFRETYGDSRAALFERWRATLR